MNFKFILETKNIKTGPIPVTYSSSNTCPDSCGLKANKACYAKAGHLLMHWNKLDKAGLTFDELVEKIQSLPSNTVFRHNIFGDLVGQNDVIDAAALKKLVKASKGKKGYAYTHYPINKKNNAAIKHANKNGLTINLSADNLVQADEKYDANVGPVTCVLPVNSKNTLFTPKGRKVIKCPAQYRNITCKECQLCIKPNRTVIVGFEAHGVGKYKIS